MSATPAKTRYFSPSIEVDASVSLGDFSDSQLKAEYAHRFNTVEVGLIEPDDSVEVSRERLIEIRTLWLRGRSSEAMRAAEDLVRDALGTAL